MQTSIETDPYFLTPDAFPVSEIPPRPPVVGDKVVFGGRKNPCLYTVLGIEDGMILVQPPHWKPPTMTLSYVEWMVEGAVPVRGWMCDDCVRSNAIIFGYGDTPDQWLFADDTRAQLMPTIEFQIAVVRNSRNRKGMTAPGAEGDLMPCPPCEKCGAWPCRNGLECPDWLTLAGLNSRRGFVSIGQAPAEDMKEAA